MKYLTETEARRFAEAWLPAWTGNNPEHLASFYSDDAFYLDPAIPEGVKGKPALIAYFKRLLAYNPNWIWKQIEGIPLEHGFLNKGHPLKGPCQEKKLHHRKKVHFFCRDTVQSRQEM